MDIGMPTLLKRELLLAKLPKMPADLPLSTLLSAIAENDLAFKGLGERELFERAYGDIETGRREYAKACRIGADDPCVRAFALTRFKNMAQAIVAYSKKPR